MEIESLKLALDQIENNDKSIREFVEYIMKIISNEFRNKYRGEEKFYEYESLLEKEFHLVWLIDACLKNDSHISNKVRSLLVSFQMYFHGIRKKVALDLCIELKCLLQIDNNREKIKEIKNLDSTKITLKDYFNYMK